MNLFEISASPLCFASLSLDERGCEESKKQRHDPTEFPISCTRDVPRHCACCIPSFRECGLPSRSMMSGRRQKAFTFQKPRFQGSESIQNVEGKHFSQSRQRGLQNSWYLTGTRIYHSKREAFQVYPVASSVPRWFGIDWFQIAKRAETYGWI